ncbi:hypothetical protein NKDENANG_02225 [Candidatus Entotheonellaceae bacterium PAL068K]
MWTEVTSDSKQVTDYVFRRVTIDLTDQSLNQESIACEDVEDFLGGIGRSFKLLGEVEVVDAFAPSSPLIMNLGIFSGTDMMTGLRIFFSGYSPIKVANNGRPLAMWSTASGKFATKLLAAGVNEVVFCGRAAQPLYLLISKVGETLSCTLQEASGLLGKTTHEKVLLLTERHADSHAAVLGPAGENWQHNSYAAIACSTVNELQSDDCKPRFAGRGGMGSIMGSKNLLAIVAQASDLKRGKLPPGVLAANKEISRGEGSRNYRDASKGNGGGGTWRNVAGLHPLGALPEQNFWPQGDEKPASLFRDTMETSYVIKDESCFKCGINCHKNVYSVQQENGRRRAGKFFAKLDYEPLDLLAINLGIYESQQALDVVELVDQLGFDSISLGTTLGYVMDYNRQHPETPILGGLEFGDFASTCRVIEQTAAGQCPEVGRGVKRLAESLGDTGYAMHCKGLELPAYLPETNPGYPFALAGGHMSMRTFLLLVFEGKTDLEYWVDAIVNRGIYYTRDDLVGLCKFAGAPDGVIEPVFKELFGVTVTADDMKHATQRTYLRGLLLERKQGTTLADYVLPARTYEHNPHVKLPHFITPEFWQQLRTRVFKAFDEQIAAYGLQPVV